MATKNQEKVFEKVLTQAKKSRKISVSKAMLESGLSPSYAAQPQQLTSSKGWKELVEKHMPDSFLAKRHRALFDQKKVEYFSFPRNMDDDEITLAVEEAGLTLISISVGEKAKLAFYSTADVHAVTKALEMAHKIKGVYQADKTIEPQRTINYNLFYQPTFQQTLRDFEEKAKQAIEDAKPTQEIVEGQ